MNNSQIKNLIWSILDRFGSRLLQFLTTIILARLISPEVFGEFGIIIIFVLVLRVLIEGGLGLGIIQEDELPANVYSSLFFFNIMIAVLLYFIIFVTSPIFSSFYTQDLTIYIRILSVAVIFDSISVVPLNLLIKRYKLRQLAIVNFISSIAAGIFAIVFGIIEPNIYALIIFYLMNSLIRSVLLLIYWQPSFTFDFYSIKKLLSFGYKLSLANLLNEIFENLYLNIIGIYYKANLVGYYYQAKNLYFASTLTLSKAIENVIFPFLSEKKKSESYKHYYFQILSAYIILTYPLVLFFITYHEIIIDFIFGEKWEGSAIFFQILSFGGFVFPFTVTNFSVMKSKGKSDLFLYSVIANRFSNIVLIILTVKINIYYLIVGKIISSYILFYITQIIINNIINTKWKELLINLGSNFLYFFLFAVTIIVINIYLNEYKYIALFGSLLSLLIFYLILIKMRIHPFNKIFS